MFLITRRILVALAILVGLLIAALAVLPSVLSFDSVRTRLLAAAESALHRKVEARTIRFQIFSGLGARAEGVVVHNEPGWETPALLTAERVSVKLAFWPLLSRRIEIRRIVLEGATATIERDRKGRLNVDGVLSAGRGSETFVSGVSSAGRGSETFIADEERWRPAAIRVSDVVIAGAQLRFVDRKVRPGSVVTTMFDAIQGRVAGISAISPTYVEISGRLLSDTERNVAFKGMVGPPRSEGVHGKMPVDATISAKGLALARLGPYLGPGRHDPGVLTIETTAKGAFSGALRLAGRVAFVPGVGRDARSAIPPIDGQFRGVLNLPRATLSLEPSSLTVASLPLSLQGRIDGLRTRPRLDLSISTRGEVPAERVTALPAVAAALPPGVRLSGRLRVNAHVRGPAGQLAVNGSADASPLTLSDGEGAPLLAAPYATATLESRRDGLRSGRLTIPNGALKKVPFENLSADWSWDTGHGTLRVVPAADVFGGRIAARLESELGKAEPLSRVTVELAGLRGDRIVEAATTTRGKLDGAITGRLSLVSRGLTFDAIQRTAHGEGHLTVSGPDLYTVHMKPEIARKLATIGKYAAGFLTLPNLESMTFDQLDTSLALADGRLATPDLTLLAGQDAAVEAAGALGFDKTLSYRGRFVLQPALVEKLGTAGRYIADARGRVVLPFQVSGTITDPKVAIDTSALMDLGRRLAARLAGDRLGGWWKVLGEAIGSGALPMPGSGGFPMPGSGGFPLPGMGGFRLPGGAAFPRPPSPADLLKQFITRSSSQAPQREDDNSPQATEF